ncbi:hypothetical protein [Endozoicomonas euniceicola]|uniref:Uncharacterized protein n=1 Tax=Endozoicomonas euniceicola TaxID=1234143 RepID=A0ABY6GV34_9GAMM|nr:hypothetical protein [Endozoicomonas euniceicola]UYM16442.1 hypothetical protein NX720_00465 [Endozoicomonas euniceicola]
MKIQPAANSQFPSKNQTNLQAREFRGLKSEPNDLSSGLPVDACNNTTISRCRDV